MNPPEILWITTTCHDTVPPTKSEGPQKWLDFADHPKKQRKDQETVEKEHDNKNKEQRSVRMYIEPPPLVAVICICSLEGVYYCRIEPDKVL